MPQHVIVHLRQLANTQPYVLEFRDCNNQPMITTDDDLYNDADDESYDLTGDYDASDIA